TAFIFTVMDTPENKAAMIGRFAVSTLRLLPGFTMAWLRMAWYAGARALPWRMPFVPRQGTITLVLTSRKMHPPTPLLKNPRFVFVGPAIDPALRPEKFDFARLDGRPLIFVSLGTVLFTNRAFFDSCIEAFADFPGQVLLSVGPGTDLAHFADAPANFIFAGSVPQLEILPRTSVFITHAGLNSIQEALWFGVPMVAVPHTPEQARNARIDGEFGAAVVLGEESFGREVTAPELRAAVDRVIGDPAYPLAAVELGKTLHEAGGFSAAADQIEALLAR
ncbi:MAG TPA: nucleotide disphospho-sugar-binding domain-containing protein, partial [Pirellulales bacterium]|nr:nucleotide disphospho-sugar-binding domain-containing protein [Pirellulales bacterium]